MTERYPRAHLAATVGLAGELPEPAGEEFCVLGRSNVGKSSFINHVFGDRGLARVSKTPGKTTLANFYALDNGTFWIDLPGYGYARASRGEQARMTGLVRRCCAERPGLRGVLWLLDIRHPGLAIDREAWAWLSSLRLAALAVLTKTDTVSPAEARRLAQEHARAFPGIAPVPFSERRTGMRDAFWQAYRGWAPVAGREQGPSHA